MTKTNRDICYCRKNPCICLQHDAECESELTSHGYTPCRCEERENASLRARMLTLEQALLAHRADLHEGSSRPCPTCRASAKALGIDGKVPDRCSRGEWDQAAIAASRGREPLRVGDVIERAAAIERELVAHRPHFKPDAATRGVIETHLRAALLGREPERT